MIKQTLIKRNLSTWRKAWALLDGPEKLNAWIVLGVIIVGALASALMVGSVMPFLAVLADPSRVEETPVLAKTYIALGFTSKYDFLIALGLASFAVILLSSVIQITKTWAVERFATMLTHFISHRLFETYLEQPYAFFLNRHSGDMGPRVLAEASQVVRQFLRPAAEFIAASLTSISIVGLVIWVNPIVALTAFAVLGGAYVGIYLFLSQNIKRLGQAHVEENRQKFRVANEAFSGIKAIKLIGLEPFYLDKFGVASSCLARTQFKMAVFGQVPQFAMQPLAFGGIILICLLLVDSTIFEAGASLGLLIPVLGVFAFAGQRLMPELSKIYTSSVQMQAGAAAVDAVYDDLALKKSVREPSIAAICGLGLKKTLRLESVSYSYPNSDKAGVRDVSISIRAGEKIGIVGGTGAGKTTLADVILGLLEPNFGRIVVDGLDITPKNARAWRRSVGYVPQEIFLTDAPIAENIAFGFTPEQIDLEHVRKVCKFAQIDHFIENELPESYQTRIGENGVRLSGGQRQRIGIARALYQNVDLIVFDEATSALDNLTEAEVMNAVEALPGNKTVLMIAHRLSTVKRCDRIMVLDKGLLVGCDAWHNLIENNTIFQRIAHFADV